MSRRTSHCTPIDPETILLSSDVSIAQYRRLESERDRQAIAEFLRERFEERYLMPLLDVDKEAKNGFAMMAIGCLMIEALECFRRGWKNSRGKSKKAFLSFFAQWPEFGVFGTQGDDFFYDVRCGILHRAETTGGWRIRRRGPLFDQETKIINATRFLKNLRKVLEAYCEDLGTQPWESEVWRRFRKRMDYQCQRALR